jgi:hypothetical protein
MNDRSTLRIAGRRAALQSAIRTGDAPAAARAAARLRLPATELSASELTRGREARRTLGLAIIKARLPKSAAAPTLSASVVAPRRRDRRRALLSALLVLAILLLFISSGGPGGSEAGSPQDPLPDPQQTQVERLIQVSRGRTVALPPVVAVVVPSQTPTPTPEPSQTESATPQPTVTAKTTAPTRTATPRPTSGIAAGGAGGSGAGGAGGTGGSGSGGAGGTGGSGSGGAGGGSGSGTGFPTLAPLPPFPPSGFGRFSIIVLDGSTGRPIPGACVVIGTQNCLPSAPHTDINGQWSVDIPATTQTTLWDLYFSKAGYVFERRQLGLAAGRTVTFTILLRRSR